MYELMAVKPSKKVQGKINSGSVIIRRACTRCGKSSEEKKRGVIQWSAVRDSPDKVPPIVHEVLHEPGRPLDAETRAFMEPRFGHDFSGVRVHTDTKAAESARGINALAYTVGRDVVFDAGQYRPSDPDGQRLLAHEMVHVIQQKKSVSPGEGALRNLEHDPAEREAERISDTLIRGGIPSMSAGHAAGNPVRQSVIPGVVQMQPAPGPGKTEEKKKPGKRAGDAGPTMPLTAYYVSKTQADIQVSGKDEYNRCGKDLWNQSSVNSVLSEAGRIFSKRFGITFSTKTDDLGCIRDAYIIQELSSLKKWVRKEMGAKGKRPDASSTNVIFFEGFYKNGSKDNTVGEVEDICGNLAAIINTGNRKEEGRILAHELGHTLCLYHPRDMGLAATSDPAYQTCAEGDYLMDWGEGTCVSIWERSQARNSGKKMGRFK